MYDTSHLLNEVKCDALSKFDSNGDMTPIYETIESVSRMSLTARNEGLLALEEKFVVYKNPKATDLSRLTLMIVDGCDPVLVAEVATNMYWANKYEGNEALIQYILMRGALMVQSGENPLIIEKMLITLLPNKLQEDCTKFLKMKKEQLQKEADAKTIATYKQWENAEPKTDETKVAVNKFEQAILSHTDRDIQRMLRDIDNDDLIKCLSLSSEITRGKILKNVSERLGIMFMYDMMSEAYLYKHFRSDEKITNVLMKVNNIIDRLESLGEIES